MPGLSSGAKVPGPGSNSLFLLSQGCTASPDPTASPLTSLYSSPSPHSPQQPCCIPQSSAGHKGNLGQVPVNLRVTPMLVISDRTIPFPELRPISSRALGCGGAGRFFSHGCQLQGILHPIPPYCWVAVRAVPSGRLGWALCLLPSSTVWLYHQLAWEHSVRPWWSSWGWFGMKHCSPSHTETSHHPR